MAVALRPPLLVVVTRLRMRPKTSPLLLYQLLAMPYHLVMSLPPVLVSLVSLAWRQLRTMMLKMVLL